MHQTWCCSVFERLSLIHHKAENANVRSDWDRSVRSVVWGGSTTAKSNDDHQEWLQYARYIRCTNLRWQPRTNHGTVEWVTGRGLGFAFAEVKMHGKDHPLACALELIFCKCPVFRLWMPVEASGSVLMWFHTPVSFLLTWIWKNRFLTDKINSRAGTK